MRPNSGFHADLVTFTEETLYEKLHFYAVHWLSKVKSCFIKRMLLKISQNSQENTCTRSSFDKLAGRACSFIEKQPPAGTLLWICKISQNFYFVEHLEIAASFLVFNSFEYFLTWTSNILKVCSSPRW